MSSEGGDKELAEAHEVLPAESAKRGLVGGAEKARQRGRLQQTQPGRPVVAGVASSPESASASTPPTPAIQDGAAEGAVGVTLGARF